MPQTSEEFIARWSASGGGERANYVTAGDDGGLGQVREVSGKAGYVA